MENLNENDEDSLELASKTWNRVIDSASKSGFREGITDGSMSVFQDGFDRGYKEAFKTTLLIGVYKGLASCLGKDLKHPTEIENLLSATKRGKCYLCDLESDKPETIPQKSITEIENCQQQHSNEILKTLQNYFNPFLKDQNIDLDFLNLYASNH